MVRINAYAKLVLNVSCGIMIIQADETEPQLEWEGNDGDHNQGRAWA